MRDGANLPPHRRLHLSTLTHQILSVIAEHGGVNAKRLYATLCKEGPFRRADPHLFSRLLRQLGMPDVALIEQAPDGDLLLGQQGERLVDHYSFYSVFRTPEEYRIITHGKLLGTLPMMMIYTPGMTIIYSGRRWRITVINERDRVIEVTADRGGRPPRFRGSGNSPVHDRVVKKMKEVLSSVDIPLYLDQNAVHLLENARSEFGRLDLDHQSICTIGERSRLIATWAGTVKTATLALRLQAMGYKTGVDDGFINVSYEKDSQSVEAALGEIARSVTTCPDSVLSGEENLVSEKFHSYLSPDLLVDDALSCRIDLGALPELARSIIENKV